MLNFKQASFECSVCQGQNQKLVLDIMHAVTGFSGMYRNIKLAKPKSMSVSILVFSYWLAPYCSLQIFHIPHFGKQNLWINILNANICLHCLKFIQLHSSRNRNEWMSKQVSDWTNLKLYAGTILAILHALFHLIFTRIKRCLSLLSFPVKSDLKKSKLLTKQGRRKLSPGSPSSEPTH